jgi:hypothetical protein
MKKLFKAHSVRILLALATLSSWALVLGAGQKWD